MTVIWVKNLTAGLALAVAIVGGSGSALAQKNGAGSQATTFDPPGAGMAAGQGTFPQQNLNSGAIIGYYVDGNSVAHGFIRSAHGKYTIINVPGAAGTQAFGINDEGTAVGWWFEAKGAKGVAYHGYLRFPQILDSGFRGEDRGGQRRGSADLQWDRPGDGEEREKEMGALPHSLPQVFTAKLSRMGGSLYRAFGVGTKLLPATTQPRQRSPRCGTSSSVQMDSHPISLLERRSCL